MIKLVFRFITKERKELLDTDTCTARKCRCDTDKNGF
jgi:hypothetical protein